MTFHEIKKKISILGFGLFILATIVKLSGVCINTTKSIPLGLYRAVDEPIQVGSYVLFCPPNKEPFLEAKRRGYLTKGFCTGGYGYMMKKVLAAKKDFINVGQNGVFVNSNAIPLSKPLNADGLGRPMPHYQVTNYYLDDNELLLMSDVSATSFDSRYFGPINKSQVKTVIKPLYLW